MIMKFKQAFKRGYILWEDQYDFILKWGVRKREFSNCTTWIMLVIDLGRLEIFMNGASSNCVELQNGRRHIVRSRVCARACYFLNLLLVRIVEIVKKWKHLVSAETQNNLKFLEIKPNQTLKLYELNL